MEVVYGFAGTLLASSTRRLADSYWSNVHDSQSTTINTNNLSQAELNYLIINLCLRTRKEASHLHLVNLSEDFLRTYIQNPNCPRWIQERFFGGEGGEILMLDKVMLPTKPFYIRSKPLEGSTDKRIWIQVIPVLDSNNNPVSFEFWTYQNCAGIIGGVMNRAEARSVLSDTLIEMLGFPGMREISDRSTS